MKTNINQAYKLYTLLATFKIKQMKTINRNEIEVADYQEIFKKESHHTHEVIEDEKGTLRWRENKTAEIFLKNISLNDLCPLLSTLGYGKNSEVYRKLYRDMGYSLSGYWEIFYWDMNNDDADSYEPNCG